MSEYGSYVKPLRGPEAGAQSSSTVTMSGGFVEGELRAFTSSIITIVGINFAVDGTPVPYGNLTASYGTLAGTLASGDSLNNVFYRGGGAHTGNIRPVPPPMIPIEIDIMPGSDTNPINPLSPGLITVALLGSDTFNMADVDVTTLAFGPDGAEPAFDLTNPWIYLLSHWDVNGDDKMDLLSLYSTAEIGIAVGDTKACLTGETLGGVPLAGCDHITTEPACGLGAELALLLPPLMWLHRRRRRRS